MLCIIGTSLIVVLGTWMWRTSTQGATLCGGCNIVVISLDALPDEALYDESSTIFSFPLLLAQAKTQGVQFTEAHTSTKQGWLANATLLSGIYPWELGMWRPDTGIPQDIRLLPEILQEYGYETAGFTRSAYVDAPWGFNRGFTTFSHNEDLGLGDTFTLAQTWLEKREDTAPFFLFLQPTDLYDWFSNDSGTLSYAQLAQAYSGNEQALDNIQHGYVQNMEALDARIDTFQKSLGSYTERPTIIVVVGSYGDEFLQKPTRGIGDGPLPRKNWLHVPLVMFIPNVPAREIPSTVETRAVADTLRVLVGARATFESIESLVPYIEGKKTKNTIARAYTVATNEPTFTVSPDEYETFMSRVAQSTPTIPEKAIRNETFEQSAVRSLIQGPWHLLSTTLGGYSVFNTNRDPFEERDLKEVQHTLTREDKARVGALLSELLQF